MEGREGKGKKYEWIQSLQERQIRPKMKILETVDDVEQARKQERHWIQYYISKGVQLTNIVIYEKEEKALLTKVAVPDGYCTRSQAREILGVSISTFNVFLRRGIITNAFPDRQDQIDCYLKSDIDKLATKLERFCKKYGPGKIISYTTSSKRAIHEVG